MKHFTKHSYVLIFLLVITNGYAQHSFMDSLKAMPHQHTPFVVFSGEADESIVCYKSAHRNVFFIITGLIVALALVLLKLYFFNKKTNSILKMQNTLIEEKNKNITDSINYAKRLQNAILPSDDSIQNILPEHFILYQPKDIVSGDFYWISEHSTKIIVAAIDCTGHGVPGALLSIVGHNAINKTINELGITKPSEVMHSMNTIIKNVLHQDSESNVKDGMDMALCTYDKTTGILEYAGANNPLYIVSENKLTIIKASKLTVGTVEAHITEPPKNHTIQLKKGDCFYVFSDGFADQFGGEANKKFKSSGLQNLLVSVANYSLEKQKVMIADVFNSWKGNNEQVDDVLVIGIRV
jgi:serine phosphatase RsbU (regulator of sigma subunit)